MIILLSCLYSRIRAYILLLPYLLLSTYPTLSGICPNSGYLVYVPCPAYTPKFIPVPLSSPTYCYLPILPFPVYVPIHNYPPILPYLLLSTYPILSCLSPYAPLSLILYMSLYSQIHTNHPHSSIVTYPPFVVFEFAFLVAVKRET